MKKMVFLAEILADTSDVSLFHKLAQYVNNDLGSLGPLPSQAQVRDLEPIHVHTPIICDPFL